MTTVKAMKFDWGTLKWGPVEVDEKVMEEDRKPDPDGIKNFRNYLTMEEYERVQQVEEEFKASGGSGFTRTSDRLPGEQELTDSPESTDKPLH